MKNKRINITGACFPEEDYMVDISERPEKIKLMIIKKTENNRKESYVC